MTIPSTFTLLDGKKIPVIGWGNGSGNARTTAVISGEIALKGGLRHIDTAQVRLCRLELDCPLMLDPFGVFYPPRYNVV